MVPLANPLRDNPLRTRRDVQRAVGELFRPLLPHFSPGGARVRLGSTGALFGEQAETLEGFARPLYGLIPYEMGGGRFEHWDVFRRGLASGTDPSSTEYWGNVDTQRIDQRCVEMAVLGMGLALVPAKLWHPLTSTEKTNVVAWLEQINRATLPANNWHFFRILVNLGLASVGHEKGGSANEQSHDVIESHYDGDGYYHDGPADRIDYYVAWAYHTYGLVYARMPGADPERARTYRERARAFVPRFQYWFDDRGAAIPFGRSQTYRFAQASVFGALAFADEEALPWSRLKGLYLRHLRYWSRMPISDRDGVTSLGYAYANLNACEPYSSPCSPYWCMKAFLALAAPATHPFWCVAEEPSDDFDRALDRVRSEPRAGMVFQRGRGDAVMLNAGQYEAQWPNSPAKYGKFAYSSFFGFSVAVPEGAPEHGVHDSMLAFREDTGPWRVRTRSRERRIHGALVFSRWEPWPDVRIDTILWAAGSPWHVRAHFVRSGRRLHTSEQGFALGRDADDSGQPTETRSDGEPSIAATTAQGTSGIVDIAPPHPTLASLHRRRRAELQWAMPNTSLIWPRTVIPSLLVSLEPGAHVLACAVVATGTPRSDAMAALPVVTDDIWDFLWHEMNDSPSS